MVSTATELLFVSVGCGDGLWVGDWGGSRIPPWSRPHPTTLSVLSPICPCRRPPNTNTLLRTRWGVGSGSVGSGLPPMFCCRRWPIPISACPCTHLKRSCGLSRNCSTVGSYPLLLAHLNLLSNACPYTAADTPIACKRQGGQQ